MTGLATTSSEFVLYHMENDRISLEGRLSIRHVERTSEEAG